MKRQLYYQIAAEHSSFLRQITILPPVKEMPRNVVMRARAIPELGIILVRRPDTLEKLWRFLHECAHCKLHRLPPNAPDPPYHWLELEAERYALSAIRQAGIVVPERFLEARRFHLQCEMMADLRAGLEPHPEVWDYLGMAEPEVTELLDRLRALPRTTGFLRGGIGTMTFVPLTKAKPPAT